MTAASGRRSVRVCAVAIGAVAALASPAMIRASAATAAPRLPHIVSTCAGQNAEVEQAVDRHAGYVYAAWMGCKGIGFAYSADLGRTWSASMTLPASFGAVNSWDPAVAVGPDGTVYAAFMRFSGGQAFPIVDASFDHGRTFMQTASLIPPDRRNWGDRDFIAVGPATRGNPHGTVYVTWDYGPERHSVTYICSKTGSCAFLTGDLNAVMQESLDGGRTWSPMSYVSPGFPASGGDSAPLVVQPDGRIDVLYQGYDIYNTHTYAMHPAHSYFTSASRCTVVSLARGGLHCNWSPPVVVGGTSSGTMSLWEWWIDGDISTDAAGNLYATWDTQVSNTTGTKWGSDTGWFAYSTDGGRRWSDAIRAPLGSGAYPHIMEVAGAGDGTAFVSWLTTSDGVGYAEYLRAYRIGRGWVPMDGAGGDRVVLRVSQETYGNASTWPGDTTGIDTLSPDSVILSWGSTNGPTAKRDLIWSATVSALS